MTNADRRRSPRVRIVAVTAFETLGRINCNDQGIGTVTDISQSGIGIETGQPPIKGQRVMLRISIDDQIHEITARAKRVERQHDSHFYRVGLDWSDCSEEERAFVEQAIGEFAD
ncbi:MAG TPA: PilZ domain-containing protein [bacterium]|nr:PilZ domain-containing protein [bacterium]